MFSIEVIKPYPKDLIKYGVYEIILQNYWIYITSGLLLLYNEYKTCSTNAKIDALDDIQ